MTRQSEVSLLRLHLLRATYLLILVFLVTSIWPGILHHSSDWGLRYGVEGSLLAAMAPLLALGLRYPLQLLPVLLFELLWKSIWLIAVALPLWSSHQIDADTAETIKACLLGWVIFPLVIPWRYVFAHYLKQPGDRWR